MKYPSLQPQGHGATSNRAPPTLEATCRESLDDLKNGRVESLCAYVESLEARLKNMRAARAGK
jgi:hypothetical protein